MNHEPDTYRVVRREPATHVMIPVDAIQDERLSYRATGILCMMLSYPHDWVFYDSHLIDQKKEGRDAFRTARAELIKAGYLLRRPVRNEDGTLAGQEWLVADDPTVLLEIRQTENPHDGKPATKGLDLSSEDLDLRPKTYNPVATENQEHGDLPAHVDPALWAEYEQHRGEMRRKLTPTSRKRALALLAKHPTEANAMITRTLERGWTGLFAFSDADRRSMSERRQADDAAAPAAYEEKPMEDLLGGRLEGRRR